MTSETLPPAFILLLGAFVLLGVPARVRSAVFVLFAALGFGHVMRLPLGTTAVGNFAEFQLILLSVDSVNRVFGMIFSLIVLIGGIYAWHVKNRGEPVAAMLYAAGALGVTFAGDFITLLIWWEVMAIASTALIYARGTAESRGAAMRYLLVHLLGGSVLLGGVAWHYAAYGHMLIGALDPSFGGAWLILFGVALNAAIPPLHPWLPDAYPSATVTGTIFMGALTTKSAVYVLMRLFPGWEVLVWAGVIMAIYGLIYAVLANDIRRILAYSIISQVGYMVTGIGLGTALSLNGTAAHAYSHILYKALLLMGAGVVLHTTGKSKLSELGGLGKYLPLTLWLFMIGALSISGVPLFNGFISKSMIVSSAGEAHREGMMLVLFVASVGSFLHTGLRIPVFTFWGPDVGLRPSKPPVNMIIAMVVAAALCVFYGCYPSALYRFLPFEAEYHPYTIPHLVESVQLLTFTFIGFWVFRRKLQGEPLIVLETDWIYRRGLHRPAKLLLNVVNGTFGAAARGRDHVIARLVDMAQHPLRPFRPADAPRYDENEDRLPLGTGLAITVLFLVLLAVWAAQ